MSILPVLTRNVVEFFPVANYIAGGGDSLLKTGNMLFLTWRELAEKHPSRKPLSETSQDNKV